MDSFSFNFPGTVIFGAGARQKITVQLRDSERVLLIGGAGALKRAWPGELRALLNGRIAGEYFAVSPEPTLEDIARLRHVWQDCNATTGIAVGGGSVIDTAKSAAAMVDRTESVADFFYQRAHLSQRQRRLLVLPTTAGTGAEVTPNGVFTDPETQLKQSIRSVAQLPDVALVDPELTLSCPAAVTAASGLDALTQAIESYIGRGANLATRSWSLTAANLIFPALAQVWAHPDDLAARSAMSEGTLLGALAFASSGLGAVHGLAHPLGAKYHIPHGKICGLLLPEVLRWNQAPAAEELKTLAHGCGFSGIDAMIERIENYLQQFNFERKLSAYGLLRSDFDAIVRNSRSGSMRNNPRNLSDAELYQLLEDLL